MIVSFLSFLENSTRVRAAVTVRLMDDMWLFDDDQKTLIGDFLLIQRLLSDRGPRNERFEVGYFGRL